MNEQNRAEREADDDGFRQAHENRQQERHEQHGSIAAARTQQRGDGIALDHVPRDDGEHARERRERNEARERRRKQHEREQEQRVQHAGHGAVRAGAHVGRRARDRARHADAAEQARSDVGDALRDELAVASDAGGPSCRRQRRPTTATRWRRAARTRRRSAAPRAPCPNRRRAATATAGCSECRRNCEPIVMTSSPAPAVTAAAPATAISMPGHSGRQRFRPTMTAIVASDTAIVVPSNVGRARQSTGSLSISSPGSGSASVEPEQILELAREDDDGDAGRESDRHGIGDELDVGAELEEADRREHRARQHRREQQARRGRAPAPSPPRAR